ncbi:MAG: hypothetical protein JWO30_1387 [Fibrobacteres bacterium]|nr:hypothetical protein [Fibrobacterota bacterium]
MGKPATRNPAPSSMDGAFPRRPSSGRAWVALPFFLAAFLFGLAPTFAQEARQVGSSRRDSAATVSPANSLSKDSLPACGLSLTGLLREAVSGKPVRSASVRLEKTGREATSDSTGRYRLDMLCPGHYDVLVTAPGLLPSRRDVDLQNGDSADFALASEQPAPGSKMVVKVQGKRAPKSLTQTQSVLSGAALDKTRGKSLGEALKSVNGVTGLQSGASIVKPVIDGLHSNRILIMNNGVRQEGQQWGSEHAPEIDPFLATQITVIKGAAGVRYGSDAIGGVVLLEPPPFRSKPGVGGELNLVGYSNNHEGVSSGSLEGSPASIPGLGWRLQGTAKKAGETQTPDYFINNTGFQEFNYSTALGYQKEGTGLDLFYSRFHTKLGIFSGTEIGSVADIETAIRREKPLVDRPFYWDSTYQIANPYQTVDHQLFKARAFTRTGNLGILGLTYALQNDNRDEFSFRFEHKDLPVLLFNITTQTAELVWEHNPVHGFKGSAGISGIAQENYYQYRDFVPNFKDYGGGAFWTEAWTAGKLQLEGGARYDYRWRQIFRFNNHGFSAGGSPPSDSVLTPEFQYQTVSEMLGAAYAVTPDLKAKINLSSAWRPPGVNELYSYGIHQSAGAFVIGDTSLQAERSYDLTGDLEYHFGKKLSLELSAYYNYIQDYIYLEPVRNIQTATGAFLTFQYRQTDAVLGGVDLTADYKFTDRVSYQGRVSSMRGFNERTKQYLFMMPADRCENGFTYAFPAWKRLSNAYAGASLQTVLRQKYAPPASLDHDLPTPDGYNLLNLDAGLSLSMAGRPVDFELGANNVLDEKYREYTDQFRYFVDEMGLNIFLRMKMPFELGAFASKQAH